MPKRASQKTVTYHAYLEEVATMYPSDEDDSTFRLHIVLLTTTLLMRRFERGPVQ